MARLGTLAAVSQRSGRSPPHLRFVERRSRKLARTLFHAMVRFGPKLELRQAVLFRLVDVGAELFAMAATVSRAHALATQGDAQALELADVFCRHARRRADQLFRETFGKDDVATYRLAQKGTPWAMSHEPDVSRS